MDGVLSGTKSAQDVATELRSLVAGLPDSFPDSRSDLENVVVINIIQKQVSRTGVITPELTNAILDLHKGREYWLELLIYGKGVRGSEPLLVRMLNQNSDEAKAREVAIRYLNSGNDYLASSAMKWARDRGYTITTVRGGVSKWGSN